MRRAITAILISAAALLCLCACGKSTTAQEAAETPVPTAQQTPAPAPEAPSAPVRASAEPSDATREPGNEPAATPEPTPTPEPTAEPEPTASPTPTATPAPTPEPEPTPLPLVAGTFTGSDGSVLTVSADGTCAYETTLSGTVNNIRAEGRVTFHGTVADGVFTFDKVMYYGLDVTEIGRASGYTDYSYWEQAAAVIYAGGISG